MVSRHRILYHYLRLESWHAVAVWTHWCRKLWSLFQKNLFKEEFVFREGFCKNNFTESLKLKYKLNKPFGTVAFWLSKAFIIWRIVDFTLILLFNIIVINCTKSKFDYSDNDFEYFMFMSQQNFFGFCLIQVFWFWKKKNSNLNYLFRFRQ